MARIDCLIFSKDRPAQLDLLLRSIERHAPGLYGLVTVLWTASAPEYRKGYEIVTRPASHPWVLFLEQTVFQDDVWRWLESPATQPLVSFLCDDDVFYRRAREPLDVPWSFRGGDYDYPFSLDGNVYAKADVIRLLHGLHFGDPTELEHQGHTHRKRLLFTEVPHGEPCLVGIPANRVSVSSGMPHMGVHEFDLNERFLAGERLALPHVDGTPGAHAELPLEFVAAERVLAP